MFSNLRLLSNVEIPFLSPNSMKKLQPIDAGIAASTKMQYRRRQLKRAVDLSDVEIHEIYKIHILTAMR